MAVVLAGAGVESLTITENSAGQCLQKVELGDSLRKDTILGTGKMMGLNPNALVVL